MVSPGGAQLHGRVAEAARVGGGGHGAVPRERRRQPRPHGLEHAAPGRAPPAARGAATWARAWSTSWPATRARWCWLARPGVVEYVSANRIVVRAETRSKKADPVQDLPLDIYNLTKYRRSNQNTCINQRPIVKKGDRVHAGRRHRRRARDRPGRAGPRAQRARGLHAVGRLQLRGRHPRVGAAGQGRPLHLDPHRGVRGAGPRHQAGQGRGHARHPQRLRGGPQGPRRLGHRAHRGQGQGRRHPRRQDHAEGRDAADPGGEAAAGDLRREGGRRARHLAHRAPGHRGHGGGRQGVLAPRRGQGRPRQVDRGGGGRGPGEGLPGRDRHGRDGARPEAQEHPGGQDAHARTCVDPIKKDQDRQEGRQDRPGGARQLLLGTS